MGHRGVGSAEFAGGKGRVFREEAGDGSGGQFMLSLVLRIEFGLYPESGSNQ